MDYYDESHPDHYEVPRTLPSWGAFLLGGIITFLLVYIGVARPLAHELAALRSHVGTLEQSVWEVAGQQGTVDETNNLLATLKAQQEALVNARGTMAELQKLQRQLLTESQQTQQAMSAVAELAALKDTLLANSSQANQAADVMATSELICERLAAAADTTIDALEAGNQLLELRQNLIAEGDEVDSAYTALGSLVELRRTLDDEQSAQIDLARDRASDLLNLKDTIVDQTDDLADAISTLEVTSDLRDQAHQAVLAFENIRHWMIEVVATESLLDRAKLALEPITELGNLRHLQPERLRNIARSISREYESRVASKPSDDQLEALDIGSLLDFDSIEVESAGEAGFPWNPSLGGTETLAPLTAE